MPEIMKRNGQDANRNLRISKQIELRRSDDGEPDAPRRITGYAAVYGELSVNLGGFRERIEPGAFRDTLAEDVRALLNHDSNFVLGRTTAGTLRLAEDETGLAFEIDLSDSQTVRDLVVTPVERGDINQCSFSFYLDSPADHAWEEMDDGTPLHIVKRARIDDISVVTYPAYPQTSADVRSALQAFRPGTGETSPAAAADRETLHQRWLEHRERAARFL